MSEVDKDHHIRDAIIKIYSVTSDPDYFNPWLLSTPQQTSGTGCVIKGNRILTNAHVVANHTFIQVRRHGQSRRVKAKLLWVSHEADLAILTVEDKSFFNHSKPLEFGDLPKLQQEINVYGFPIGGDALSITKGILSRMEHQIYTHSSYPLLAGQLDAAINPGNSGGPAIVDGKIVGVIMQGLTNAENIGYMVPVTVIQHFLKDVEDGNCDGFPGTGLVWQMIENPDMKRKFGMSDDQSGICIVKVIPNTSADGLFEKEDVLMKVNGHEIAGDGTVEFRSNERTLFDYYVNACQMKDSIEMEVLRKGEQKKITLPLRHTREVEYIVPREQYDSLPRYYIFGGVVFSNLSKNLIDMWGPNWEADAPTDYIQALSARPSKDRTEIVVAVQVLAADVNTGYHDINNWTITSVNDQPVKNLKHLIELVEQNGDHPFVVFKNPKGYQIVLDRKKAEDGCEEILKTYQITRDRSVDL